MGQEGIKPQEHTNKPLALLKLTQRGYIYLSALFLVVVICWFSYLKLPFEEDQKSFLASARIADRKTEKFPFNVYSSWELKPIGNRIVVYFFYKAANLIGDYNNKKEFELALKIIYSTVIILVSFIFARSLTSAFSNGYKKVNFLLLWLITIFAFLTLYTENIFQTEEFGVIMQMVALPLMLSRRKTLNFLSGLLLAVLITIKGVTILLSVQLFVFVCLLGRKYYSKLVISFVGFLVFIVGVLLSIVTYFPDELVEMRNATLYQGSSSGIRYLGLNRLFPLFREVPVVVGGIPVAFIGGFVFLLLFITELKEKRGKEIAILLLVWFISALYVIIQGKFFTYHYIVFLLPLLVTIAMSLNYELNLTSLKERYKLFTPFWVLLVLAITFYVMIRTVMYYEVNPFISIFSLIVTVLLGLTLIRPKGFSREKLVFLLACYSLIVWFVYGSLWGRYEIREMKCIDRENNMCTEVKLKYQLDKEENILYLSDGVFTYYIDCPSFLRYYLPICLNRAKGNPSLREEPVFKETMERALSYNGKYIVCQPNWIHLDALPLLKSEDRERI